jgi:hypothetical protein
MNPTIRVAISVTLEVNREGWDMNYGTGLDANAIREDVKAWTHSLLSESSDSLKVVAFK